MPPAGTVESSLYFSIKLFDNPDVSALRDEHRRAHLDYLKRFEPQTLFAGPMITDDGSLELGSHRLLDLPDWTAAYDHVAGEPFVLGGVQEPGVIERYSPAVPHSWRNCPRTRGNIHFLIQATDDPDRSALRKSLRGEQHEYHAGAADLVLTRGDILADEGDEPLGSLLMIDVPDLESAQRYWRAEPYNAGGLFAKVDFCRWRFGRVFDRFHEMPMPQ